jgi:hypothetical protein
MKLIKTIKLHRELRIKQEVLFHAVCKWSQSQFRHTPYPNISYYYAVNHAVNRIENKLPKIYFILSDLFGGASSIKKESQKIINT